MFIFIKLVKFMTRSVNNNNNNNNNTISMIKQEFLTREQILIINCTIN